MILKVVRIQQTGSQYRHSGKPRDGDKKKKGPKFGQVLVETIIELHKGLAEKN